MLQSNVSVATNMLPRIITLLKLAALALALATLASAQDEAAVLFKARCSKCHAIDGSGKTAAGKKLEVPDLRSPKVQRLTDAELVETIAHGKNHRNYPHVLSDLGLSDQQVKSLIKHLRSLPAARN
jgi:mono/diheme cytochrome c family protein